MRKSILILLSLVMFLLSGCSSGPVASKESAPVGQAASANLNPAKLQITALNRDVQQSYSSTFVVKFEGPKPWTYQLKTRKSTSLREMSLHIEGISGSSNPGDVRLVTDGKTSWMIGPGTDNECIQYPNNQGMDPTLLYPEMLVADKDLAGLFQYAGEESSSLHFTGKAAALSGWKDAQVEAWQDKSSRALTKFKMQASGTDQFFGTGEGKLTASYDTAGLGAAIEPVKGCEINVPLPKSAKMFVRLPGMASFESPDELEAIQVFFQSQLPQAGWAEKEPASTAEGATILSYQKNGDGVEIHIELNPDGGSKVKLLFMKAQ